MSRNIRDFRELRVYDTAMDAAMEIFQITLDFPKEEKYSLTDQVRRSSRSVCSNIAEAWRKRRYRAAFIAKLSDAESEAAGMRIPTQTVHPFRSKLDSHSNANWTPIPVANWTFFGLPPEWVVELVLTAMRRWRTWCKTT